MASTNSCATHFAAGHNIRVYIPFGRDWYAYSVRRLRENPRLAGYVFKAMFNRKSNSKIVLLGTSSAIPTLTRGLSSTALVREGDVFLFDCGEGTQVQLMRPSVKRSRIHSIFIGHLHGDHLYGIAGLLSTLHLDGHEAPVNVFGPEGLRHFLNASFRTSDLQFKFELTVQEFPRGYRGRVLDEEEFYVDALPLEHSIFCLGWRFQEKDKPGMFNLERAEELGIPRGPLYGKLQHGESITLPTAARSPRHGAWAKPARKIRGVLPGHAILRTIHSSWPTNAPR